MRLLLIWQIMFAFFGTNYCTGMMLAYGSTGGLPDFAEILHMMIDQGHLFFIVKLQCS